MHAAVAAVRCAADAQDPHCVVAAVAFAAAAAHDDDNDPCDSLHACLH